MLLAFDNTDGPGGGCTTHLAFHVLLALPELALTGMPRLVRLNPNVPWKTRGNGAVVLPLGVPRGPQTRVGELQGHEVLAFPEAAPILVPPAAGMPLTSPASLASPDSTSPSSPPSPSSSAASPTPSRPSSPSSSEILDRVWGVLQAQSQPGALPGVALFDEAPPAAAYWEAVRTFVPPEASKAALEALEVPHQAAGDGRALVGCLAAAAWPGPPNSFEFIAYRQPQRWGQPREVDPRPWLGLDATGATFHTYDPEALRPCCIPHTPDPVLAGLRGRDPEALLAAALATFPVAAAREPIDGWLLWASNQASGDHVTPVDALAEAPPLGTVAIAATVLTAPTTRQGGHVVVTALDATGATFEAVAFEPTKSFRDRVRGLIAGDRVRFVGALADGAVRLEKMEVLHLAPRLRSENPLCRCGKRMRSKGPSTGFKCPACGAFLPRGALQMVEEKPAVALGWHEVPIIARRHLHRPVGWK